MTSLPPISGNLTLLDITAATSLLVTGYVIHEALHILPLKYWAIDHDIHILPRPDGGSRLKAALFGTVVDIRLIDPTSHWKVAVVALAPLLAALPPLAALALMLSYPRIDTGTLLVVGVWFAVAIPSPADWLSAFGVYQHNRSTISGGEQHGQ